ncbi:hemerythrin domain-containing protein [Motiliproteus coralliicola]|uniref:Hemerythrin domain-containing protein n=1 Tax=Motiliproteus coralliicola TaxID=2283196 RepID=A0A369WU27_9GAMM|nr:hemerythrin domain-containing protein [Motiliproteus coralliicola]RDE24559.1 hemerythrin domain-containing protein [Motiliproteus coralliicola]
MTSISEFMTSDHRRCDEFFNQAEEAVSQGKWDEAQQGWSEFQQAIEHHFSMEEQVLFPAFEQATGSTAGPTSVMRMEHDQMRQLFAQVGQALGAKDADTLLGASETLMILMQQHNMKEEQILYPMSMRALPDPDNTLNEMQQC